MADINAIRDHLKNTLVVVFEGLDGAGKSTVLGKVQSSLISAGVTVTSYRSPGGTDLGEKVRELLLHRKSDMSATSEALLFATSRQAILDDLLGNKPPAIVLLDRFDISSMAYQHAYGADMGTVMDLSRTLGHQACVDMDFYLEVSYAASRQRMAGEKLDAIESRGESFFHATKLSYDQAYKLCWYRKVSRIQTDILSVDALTRMVLNTICREYSVKTKYTLIDWQALVDSTKSDLERRYFDAVETRHRSGDEHEQTE